MYYVNLLISLAIGCGVGVYMFTMVFVEDIKNNLDAMNGMARIKNQRPQLFKQLTGAIHTHSIGKELSTQHLAILSALQLMSTFIPDLFGTAQALASPFLRFYSHGA